MSKTKLAWLVFCVAFGVNLIAFLFSKKAFIIEENKNLWIYELPPSASPLDSYVAKDLGPQDGLIGTIGRLALSTQVNGASLKITLHPGATYSNHDPILPEHWEASRAFLLPYLTSYRSDPYWNLYVTAQVEWKSADQVIFSWKKAPAMKNWVEGFTRVLSDPLTGVVHPQNLEALKRGEKITKDWISSGPYKVRKWKPKEIVLASRDDYPVMMPKEFFRTLKYQSAPIRNPSCDLIQSFPGDEKGMRDHKVVKVSQTVHIFLICRSWKEAGSMCEKPENRANFVKLLKDEKPSMPQALLGQKIRYRIPLGSDSFRTNIREMIVSAAKAGVGTPDEISFLFKPSTDADLELLMVVTDSNISSEIAEKMALSSSRLGVQPGDNTSNLAIEMHSQKIQILMKNMQGDPFSKTFIEPDLEEKKLPL